MAKKSSGKKRRPAARPPARRGKRNAAKPRPQPRAAEPARTKPAEPGLVVAGVGASAGGLETFSQLLEALPRDPGLAIILIQHLAPQHESALAQLLSARTRLPVEEVTENVPIQPNRVYVIPPNVQMELRDGHLHLSPRPSDRTQYTPIDFFLRSLAEAYQERAIAVILSGTASDGTIGVREVKSAGGITIAQKPETAKYDGMPRAAIATGLVDLVLSPAEIAAELVRIARHPLRRSPLFRAPLAGVEEEPAEEYLDEIFGLLRSATGVDFRRYKYPTIQRRLHRRMVLHKLTRIGQYLKLLHESPGEVHALYQDILIHVTRFFRDPDSYAEIASRVLPAVVESHRDEQPIRVWVPGCSTGEEAYSLAIVLLEFLGERTGRVPVQIFATDVSEAAVEHARSGLYSGAIAADVSPARLRRFFTRIDGGYKITKGVRDLCIFARQDLTRDPPFSNLDLILCRNVLIYLAVEAQRRLVTVFHYALRPAGFVVLGSAETIGLHSDLFAVVDKKYRIYQRKSGSVAPRVGFDHIAARTAPVSRELDIREHVHSVQAEANRVIQERYAPPSVIVDANLNVVQFRGQTGTFLEPPPGEPSMNLLKMAREGMLHGLRGAIQDARRAKAPARREDVRLRTNGGWREVDIEVVPLPGGERSHFLVLFGTKSARPERMRGGVPAVRQERTTSQVTRLEQELASSREYLQSIIQDLEATNEELQSANEEVLSANEELQSTNEELDTAKEELQSTNEELNTVNEELHGRNEELSRVNSDLMNLLGNVDSAIVIVASDLRIRRFTPMAERVLNLIPGDVGRPIGHLKPNLDCQDLEELITQVIDSVKPYEREVRDRQGNWFVLRIRPYKSIENRIDGAVLSLQGSQREHELSQARDYAEAIVETVREPLVVLDGTFRVRTVNSAFCRTFRLGAADSVGKSLYDLGEGQWKIPRLRTLLEEVLRDGPQFEGFEVEHDFPLIGPRTMMLNARRIEAGDGRDALILLAMEDVTRQREATRSGH